MLGFRKRAIQVTFPEIPKDYKTVYQAPGQTQIDDIRIENANRFGKDFVTHTAVTLGIVYSSVRIVNTICKIAEITAKAKLK